MEAGHGSVRGSCRHARDTGRPAGRVCGSRRPSRRGGERTHRRAGRPGPARPQWLSRATRASRVPSVESPPSMHPSDQFAPNITRAVVAPGPAPRRSACLATRPLHSPHRIARRPPSASAATPPRPAGRQAPDAGHQRRHSPVCAGGPAILMKYRQFLQSGFGGIVRLLGRPQTPHVEPLPDPLRRRLPLPHPRMRQADRIVHQVR